MEQKTVIDTTPPIAGNPSATPAPAAAPQSEDPATEAARLRQEKIDLEKRLAEKDAHISTISTEKATLEQRLSGFQAVQSVVDEQPAAEEPPAGEEPPAAPVKKGGVDVRQYPGIRPEHIPEIIERTSFINDMKKDNKDMIEADLEPSITLRADQLIRQGKSFKEAVATSVKEHRERFTKIRQPAKPAEPETPKGAMGEEGAPGNQEPPKPQAEEDEGAQRIKLRKLRGL